MKQILLAIPLTIAVLMFPTAPIAADRVVHVVTLPGYPPFTFYKPDASEQITELVRPGNDAESFTGYSWDILRESFHAAGYTVKLRITPWARAMHELKKGKVDVLFPTGKNPERLEYMHYSNGSVVDVKFLVYVRADASFEYDGLDSLAGRTIAVLRGFNYGEEFNAASAFAKQPVDSVEQGFDLVSKGRVDGFAGYDIVWDYELGELGRQGEYRKLRPFDGAKEYLTALHTNPRAEEILAAFDRGFESLRRDGTMDAIAARWRGSE